MLKLFYLLSFLRPCQVIRFCQGRDGVNTLKSSTSALPGIIWQEMITDLFWVFLSEIAFPIFTTIGLKSAKVISGSRQSIIIQCSGWVALFFVFFSHSTPTYMWPIIFSPWSVEYFIHVLLCELKQGSIVSYSLIHIFVRTVKYHQKSSNNTGIAVLTQKYITLFGHFKEDYLT